MRTASRFPFLYTAFSGESFLTVDWVCLRRPTTVHESHMKVRYAVFGKSLNRMPRALFERQLVKMSADPRRHLLIHPEKLLIFFLPGKPCAADQLIE